MWRIRREAVQRIHPTGFQMKGVVVEDAALYRILESLIDEWPETVFSEQIADVLKVNREVLDA